MTEKCYIPKKIVHTYTGHTKGIQKMQLFPVSGHIFLTCSMDSKVKVILLSFICLVSFESSLSILIFLKHSFGSSMVSVVVSGLMVDMPRVLEMFRSTVMVLSSCLLHLIGSSNCGMWRRVR